LQAAEYVIEESCANIFFLSILEHFDLLNPWLKLFDFTNNIWEVLLELFVAFLFLFFWKGGHHKVTQRVAWWNVSIMETEIHVCAQSNEKASVLLPSVVVFIGG